MPHRQDPLAIKHTLQPLRNSPSLTTTHRLRPSPLPLEISQGQTLVGIVHCRHYRPLVLYPVALPVHQQVVPARVISQDI